MKEEIYLDCESTVFHQNVIDGIEKSHDQCLHCKARIRWNSYADMYNQWEELGQDEKDGLIEEEFNKCEKDRLIEDGFVYNLPEGFIKELGCTVRTCIDCGCLVSGGPTRCTRCVKDIDAKTKDKINDIKNYFHREREDFYKIMTNKLTEENKKLKQWIDDLQSGMYINCVYCGHRYGPKDDTPCSMADVLKKHVEVCTEHPMYKFRMRVKKLLFEVSSYLHGQKLDDEIDRILKELK